jgi:hypothetical protein
LVLFGFVGLPSLKSAPSFACAARTKLRYRRCGHTLLSLLWPQSINLFSNFQAGDRFDPAKVGEFGPATGAIPFTVPENATLRIVELPSRLIVPSAGKDTWNVSLLIDDQGKPGAVIENLVSSGADKQNLRSNHRRQIHAIRHGDVRGC